MGQTLFAQCVMYHQNMSHQNVRMGAQAILIHAICLCASVAHRIIFSMALPRPAMKKAAGAMKTMKAAMKKAKAMKKVKVMKAMKKKAMKKSVIAKGKMAK